MATSGAQSTDRTCGPVDLPIVGTEPRPTQYLDFCRANAGDCTLTGPPVIAWTASVAALVAETNRDVNAEIRLLSDLECLGLEEHWSYPLGGYGDCEDFALEKRRRLAASGLPAAAMTMAIVHHEVGLFAHAVLLLETTDGTLVLDNLVDEILCWDVPPFDYERRERPDGRWVRYRRG